MFSSFAFCWVQKGSVPVGIRGQFTALRLWWERREKEGEKEERMEGREGAKEERKKGKERMEVERDGGAA